MSNPPSPLLLAGSLTSFTVKVEGKDIPSDWQVVSIDTWLSVNRIPKARIVIFDGSASSQDFPASSGSILLPGNNVSIAAGYEQKTTVIFTGIIVSQSIEINASSNSTLAIDITDKSMGMTLERKSAVYAQVKDSDLIQTLISNNGLTANVTSTDTIFEDIVQYYASDWDMMLLRAELNGFVVMTDGGKVTVAPPDTHAQPVLSIEYGDCILEFDAEMDAATQHKRW